MEIARYNENIRWLDTERDNCIIYEKGHQSGGIPLPNVGRESHTYLHYIITHYDTLPEVVVFTQARISDHKGADDVNYLLHIKNEAMIHLKSVPTAVNENIASWNLQANGSYYLHHNYKNNTPLLFSDWFKRNVHIDFPNPTISYSHAIFAVHRDLILSNPVSYYQHLIHEVDHHSDPSEGHFFERSWWYIFK